MKRFFSVAEAKKFDLYAQKKLNIPSLILMENAGRGVAEEALKILGKRGKVAVVCGVGNNGGDGLVAARHLLNFGVRTKVFILGKKPKMKDDPKINLNILEKMGQKIIWVSKMQKLKGLKNFDLIIDAIFGIGLKSEVNPFFQKAIAQLNQSGISILSVDVPSGLDADTGKILGEAIRAHTTVTFVAPKRGFFKQDGPRCCGKIIVRDIGAGLFAQK